MRHLVTAIVVLALVAVGCSDDDAATSTADAATVDSAGGDPGEGVGAEHEGEARDPGARFAEDVCIALLPALEGRTGGLEPYAEDEVLAELSDDPFHGRSDDLTITSDGETCTIGPFGDAEYVLLLQGDGHVGQRAVAIELVTGTDSSGGSDADAESAIAERRAVDGGCGEVDDSDGDEIIDVDGGTIVALLCERFAYQSIYELFRLEGNELTPLTVEQWADGSLVETDQILGFPFAEDGLLANVEKGRGIGDCGTFQRWFLDRDLLLLAAAFHQECDDQAEPVGPEGWPQVYPSGD